MNTALKCYLRFLMIHACPNSSRTAGHRPSHRTWPCLYFENLVTSYQKSITVVRIMLVRPPDLNNHLHSDYNCLALGQPYQPAVCSVAHACSLASQLGVRRSGAGLLCAFGPASMTS